MLPGDLGRIIDDSVNTSIETFKVILWAKCTFSFR